MQTATENPARPSFLDLPITDTERAFVRFHAKNPHVYMALEALALRAVKAGVKRLGMKAMVETLRYSAALQTAGDAYKIGNSYTALYARLLLADHPEMRDLLELRKRPSVSAYADA